MTRYRNCFEVLQGWTNARTKALTERNASSKPGGLSPIPIALAAIASTPQTAKRMKVRFLLCDVENAWIMTVYFLIVDFVYGSHINPSWNKVLLGRLICSLVFKRITLPISSLLHRTYVIIIYRIGEFASQNPGASHSTTQYWTTCHKDRPRLPGMG